MRKLSAVLISAAAVVCLAGCGDDGDGLACDLATPECDNGMVCVAQIDGEPACQPTCDPADPAACGTGSVCERLETGVATCLDPVVVMGSIFDLASGSPIGGARLLAVAASGEAATDVAISDTDGGFELRVPVTRATDRTPVDGTFTFRVAADGYQPYPYGIRPAIPVDATAAVEQEDGTWVLSNQSVSVGLIPLPEAQQNLGSISGKVVADLPGSTLVVAECDAPPCPSGFADMSGDFAIYNVPDGQYVVKGYKGGLQLGTMEVTVSGGSDETGVDLADTGAPTSTLNGNIQIVNPDDESATSVVLIPESVFVKYTDTYLRGEVPPGLRAPGPGIAPDIVNAFFIAGIPDGSYVVLAAFENDLLIRDPDPKIAGTQVVHVTIAAGSTGDTVTLNDSFKITGALAIYGPGADGPEEVTQAGLNFRWKDDSSEDQYILSVYDSFGNLVWQDDTIPGYSGSDPDIAYAGPALDSGMYYQWRAVSYKDGAPKSTTEDLLGVFYIPPEPEATSQSLL